MFDLFATFTTKKGCRWALHRSTASTEKFGWNRPRLLSTICTFTIARGLKLMGSSTLCDHVIPCAT